MMTLLETIARDIAAFVAGSDHSTEAAWRLEGMIRTASLDSQALEDLADALAQYQPRGGQYLHDEAEIMRICRGTLREIGCG
jgi:hypothetical protein